MCMTCVCIKKSRNAIIASGERRRRSYSVVIKLLSSSTSTTAKTSEVVEQCEAVAKREVSRC